MGLDATVYCDCLEKARMRTPPQPHWSVYIDESGARFNKMTTLEEDLKFDRWNVDACEHEDGVLLHQWLGNVAAIGMIRDTLLKTAERFPFILSKVVYNGTHCGDHVSFDDVAGLDREVSLLAEIDPKDPLAAEWIRDFEQKLRELVNAARLVKKPISF